MAILSCCFWQTVRRGSYASGLYTLIYFAISSVSISMFLFNERAYLMDEREKSTEERNFTGNTPTICPTANVIFNVMILTSTTMGSVTSFLLLYGLYKNYRQLLLPWIIALIIDIFVEASHFLYVLFFEKVERKFLTMLIFTLDFFVIILHVYCLLCVISRYQELKVGRSLKQESFPTNVNDIHFLSSSIETQNYNPSKRIADTMTTSTVMCGHVNCALTNVKNHHDIMKYTDEILPWSDEQEYYENC